MTDDKQSSLEELENRKMNDYPEFGKYKTYSRQDAQKISE